MLLNLRPDRLDADTQEPQATDQPRDTEYLQWKPEGEKRDRNALSEGGSLLESLLHRQRPAGPVL